MLVKAATGGYIMKAARDKSSVYLFNIRPNIL